jgi:hypothetical protein
MLPLHILNTLANEQLAPSQYLTEVRDLQLSKGRNVCARAYADDDPRCRVRVQAYKYHMLMAADALDLVDKNNVRYKRRRYISSVLWDSSWYGWTHSLYSRSRCARGGADTAHHTRICRQAWPARPDHRERQGGHQDAGIVVQRGLFLRGLPVRLSALSLPLSLSPLSALSELLRARADMGANLLSRHRRNGRHFWAVKVEGDECYIGITQKGNTQMDNYLGGACPPRHASR